MKCLILGSGSHSDAIFTLIILYWMLHIQDIDIDLECVILWFRVLEFLLTENKVDLDYFDHLKGLELLILPYMFEYFACMHLCIPLLCLLDPPGTGFRDGFKLLYRFWESNSSPLQEQHMLLTAEPSFFPPLLSCF